MGNGLFAGDRQQAQKLALGVCNKAPEYVWRSINTLATTGILGCRSWKALQLAENPALVLAEISPVKAARPRLHEGVWVTGLAGESTRIRFALQHHHDAVLE